MRQPKGQVTRRCQVCDRPKSALSLYRTPAHERVCAACIAAGERTA